MLFSPHIEMTAKTPTVATARAPNFSVLRAFAFKRSLGRKRGIALRRNLASSLPAAGE